MKKTITLLALVAVSMTTFAQRNIDLSLDEIIDPTELNSDLQTGTPLPIKYACRNNGSDTLVAGDTILYNGIIIDLLTNNVMLEAPSGATQGNAYFSILTRTVLPNDTVQVGRNLNINSYVAESRDIRFGGSCIALNRGANELQDTVTDNNTDFLDIVWFNPQGWGVSVEDVVYNNNIAVYPNPTDNITNIKLMLTSNKNVKVELVNMNGEVVVESDAVSTFNNVYSLNTSDVENGIYIVKVTNGDEIQTTKLSVLH